MAKNWEERVSKTIEKVTGSTIQVGSALSKAKEKTRSLLQKSTYWSAVFVIGFASAATIMHLSGVPVFEAAEAGTPTVLAVILGNMFYYAIIVPIGMFTIVVAFVLQVLITYPYGAFWNSSIIGSGTPQGFVNVNAVIVGWKIVRDVSNIFFALILVIIALATTLRIKAYEWKALLPKFFLMAILINFSKSIAGVFTDLATVAMATFAGSFAKTLSIAIITGFGVSDVTELGKVADKEEGLTVSDNNGFATLFFAYIAAAVMTMVMFVVLVVFSLMLIFRIIMLWFLIVLSPLAYITRILPQTQKYSSQWWEMFGRYVLVGPLVAFFLWLTLSITFGTTEDTADIAATDQVVGSPLAIGFDASADADNAAEVAGTIGKLPPDTGMYTATSPNELANFAIGIMMLMASLKLISQMAQEFGGVLGKAQEGAFSLGKSLLRKPGRIMQSKGATWGQGDEGALGGTKRFLGGIGTVLGTTAFQPAKFVSSLVAGQVAASQAKEKSAKQLAHDRLESMRGGNVTDGEKAPNALTRMVAAVASAGTDGQKFAEEYASAGGAWRMAKLFWANTAGGMTGDIAQSKEDADAAEAALKYENEEMVTADEAEERREGLELDNEKQKRLNDQIDGVNTLDTNKNSVSDAIINGLLPKIMERVAAMNAAGDTDGASALESLGNDVSSVVGSGGTLDAANLRQAMDHFGVNTGDINTAQRRGLENADLDLSAPEVASVVQQIMNNLQDELKRLQDGGHTEMAGKVKNQIDELAAKSSGDPKKNGGNSIMTMEALLSRFNGSGSKDTQDRRQGKYASALAQAMIAERDSTAGKIGSTIKLLENAGFDTVIGADGTGTVSGAATNLTTDAERARLKDEMSAAQTRRNGLSAEHAGLQAGMSYHGRAARAAAVNEELQKLQDVKSTDELMPFMNKAISQNDPYMTEAVIRRITQNGDENEIFQGAMAYLLQKQKKSKEHISKFATSGAEGMETFRKEIMVKKLGMTDAGSITVMNDVSFIAEKEGHLGVARKYTMKGGKWKINDEKTRNEIVAGEKAKMSPKNFSEWNRLAWGQETGMDRKFELTEASKEMLRASGNDMAQQLSWDKMNSNAKQNLSDPRIVRELRAAGVDTAFCNRLDVYHRTVGRYQGSGSGNGAGRLSRSS